MTHRLFKRVITPVTILLVFTLSIGAQMAPVEKVDLEMIKKIRTEGLEHSQVMETLSYLTDVIGPRLTGSPGMKHANEWTKQQLTSWGLQNAHLEAWGPFGRGWTLERFSAQVLEPVPFPLIAYPKAWTPGTNGPLVSEVILPDIKTEADFDKYKGKLKGMIVMANPMRDVPAEMTAPGHRLTDEQLLGMANDNQRQGRSNITEEQLRQFRAQAQVATRRMEFFRSEGVAATLEVARIGDGGTIFVQGGGPRDKNAAQALPSVVVTPEHYGRIARMLAKGVKVKVELNTVVKFYDDDPMSYNTVAEIPGSDKRDELVMVGAHMDSWHSGTGATDNGAGCAVAMEAVRILKALGVQPRRTIRIALWSGEEEGLLGSRAYVSEHFASRPAPPAGQQQEVGPGAAPTGPLTIKPDHATFSAYFNLDNGTGKVRGVYLQGNESVRGIFRAWLTPFQDLGASTLTSANTGGTDHLAFDAVGLPGFQFIQDPIEYDTRTHHSNMDVYERIQADDMKQASTIMAAFLYNAAMRDEKLPRKPAPAVQQARSGVQ
jgi:carboxypeptidase Q